LRIFSLCKERHWWFKSIRAEWERGGGGGGEGGGGGKKGRKQDSHDVKKDPSAGHRPGIERGKRGKGKKRKKGRGGGRGENELLPREKSPFSIACTLSGQVCIKEKKEKKEKEEKRGCGRPLFP